MSKKKEGGAKTAPAKERPFEEQLARLQEITGQLERGDLSLENSLALYGEGVELSRNCRAMLEKARHTVQIYTEEGLAEFGLLEQGGQGSGRPAGSPAELTVDPDAEEE